MTDNMQEFYISNIERITNNYFYSVNRASIKELKNIILKVFMI